MTTLTYDSIIEAMEKIPLEFKRTEYTHLVKHPNIKVTDGIEHKRILGMDVVESPYLMRTIQTRYPRCNKKKRRITKKFNKKYSKQVSDNNIYLIDSSRFGFSCAELFNFRD